LNENSTSHEKLAEEEKIATLQCPHITEEDGDKQGES